MENNKTEIQVSLTGADEVIEQLEIIKKLLSDIKGIKIEVK